MESTQGRAGGHPRRVAVRSGVRRGLIELRQVFTTGQDLFGQLLWPVVMLVVLYFLRDTTIEPSGLLLATMVLPSVIGMNLAMSGMLMMAQLLAVEREDGTLLRAKATPNGMVGYLVGKLVTVAGSLVIGVAIVLVPGLFIVDGLALGSAGSWLTLLWVLLLAMAATLPLGAVFGSLFPNARSLGLVSLALMLLTAISGVFYPITALPDWLRWIAQVFPIYWLGLGTRSALLPDGAVVAEVGESWRHLETVGVLGAWAVLGLVVAPVVLRRMARRESGSSVAARRERALQRVS